MNFVKNNVIIITKKWIKQEGLSCFLILIIKGLVKALPLEPVLEPKPLPVLVTTLPVLPIKLLVTLLTTEPTLGN